MDPPESHRGQSQGEHLLGPFVGRFVAIHVAGGDQTLDNQESGRFAVSSDQQEDAEVLPGGKHVFPRSKGSEKV